jgi:hypothetical protein
MGIASVVSDPMARSPDVRAAIAAGDDGAAACSHDCAMAEGAESAIATAAIATEYQSENHQRRVTEAPIATWPSARQPVPSASGPRRR